MKSLFNIEAEYLDIISQIEEAEGELTPELEEALEINAKELESKLKAYHHIIQMLKGDMVIIDDEVERLRNLKTVKDNTITRLKEAILTATLLFGEDGKTGNKKLKFDTLQTWTVNKDSVIIDENEILDSNYIKSTLTTKLDATQTKLIQTYIKDAEFNHVPDKKKLAEDLKLGVQLKAAQLVTKPYVVIK